MSNQQPIPLPSISTTSLPHSNDDFNMTMPTSTTSMGTHKRGGSVALNQFPAPIDSGLVRATPSPPRLSQDVERRMTTVPSAVDYAMTSGNQTIIAPVLREDGVHMEPITANFLRSANNTSKAVGTDPNKFYYDETDLLIMPEINEPVIIPNMGERGAPLEGYLNPARTFRFLMTRRFDRLRAGTVRNSSALEGFLYFLAVVIFCLLVGWLGNSFSALDWKVNLVYCAIIIPLIIVFFLQINKAVQSVFYLIMLCDIVLLILALVYPGTTSQEDGVFWIPHPQYVAAVRIICLIVGIYIFVALVGYYCYSYGWPWFMGRTKFNAMRFWDIRPVQGRKDLYTYTEFKWNRMRWVKHLISYRGTVNDDMEPHGLGEWRDDAREGECLIGYWEHGLPVAPYNSREYGTGNAFTALRIGYAACSAQPWNVIDWIPKFRTDGLKWGWGSVQCSISGEFFSEFPKPSMDFPGATVLESPTVVEDVAIALDLGIEANYSGNKECLLFIHGFNTDIQHVLENLGQLLALGDFPKHIKPFIFAWPAAGPITYFSARSAIETEQCRREFVEMIKRLTDLGFSKFHIIAHSMGTRLPLGIAEEMDQLFRLAPGVNVPKNANMASMVRTDSTPVGTPSGSGPVQISETIKLTDGVPVSDDFQQSLPELLTLTFLNAENDLHEFIHYKYELLRRHCKIITITADPTDGALGYAKIFGNIYPSPTAIDPSQKYEPMGICPNSFYIEDVSKMTPGAKGPRPRRRYLDVDVINTASLDANAAGIRHSYFSLNRLTVDDIRDVIVYRLRAKDRLTRLLPKDGNEFSYLSAPSWVRK